MTIKGIFVPARMIVTKSIDPNVTNIGVMDWRLYGESPQVCISNAEFLNNELGRVMPIKVGMQVHTESTSRGNKYYVDVQVPPSKVGVAVIANLVCNSDNTEVDLKLDCILANLWGSTSPVNEDGKVVKVSKLPVHFWTAELMRLLLKGNVADGRVTLRYTCPDNPKFDQGLYYRDGAGILCTKDSDVLRNL